MLDVFGNSIEASVKQSELGWGMEAEDKEDHLDPAEAVSRRICVGISF